MSLRSDEAILTTGRRLGVLALAALLGGCVALGWRFGPGYPCSSGTLFAQPPVVVQRGEEYFLTWTQGEYPYFFVPSYAAMDGRLVFAMTATSSSGSLAGRDRELQIEGAENLLALRTGGAFWWEREPEPDGRFVALTIIEDSGSAPAALSP